MCHRLLTLVRSGTLLLALAAWALDAPSQMTVERQNLPSAPESVAQAASLDALRREMEAARFAEAEGKLRVYLLQDDGSATAHYMLAYSLLRQGKAKESLEQYTRAASLRIPTATDLRNVGQDYLLLEDYTDAGKWLERSLQMEPGNPDTWYNLGRLRYAENRFAGAVQCFTKVLTLAPRNAKAENNRGLALEGLNRLPEAEAAYRVAIAWEEADPHATAREQPYLNLAIVVLHRGELAEAQTLLERAASIAPHDARIAEQLGQAFLQEGKFAEAQIHLTEACELDPGKGNLHFLLGQADKHLGQNEKARQEFAEAARLSRVSNQHSN